jgi:hypothetical protein
VSDLSAEGMALRVIDREDLERFTVGALVEGRLNLRREKVAVRARVRRLGGGEPGGPRVSVAGCEFEGLEPASRERLRVSLDPVALGAELRPVPGAAGAGGGFAIDGVWYHGPSGTDLWAWRERDGSWRRVLCVALGTVVEWEDGRGVVTGRVVPGDGAGGAAEAQGMVRLESLRIELDARPDAAKMAVAKTLLSGSILPDALKTLWVRRLSQT